MLEGLLAFLAIAVVFAVIVPLTLCVLLVRQVLRSPPVRRLRRLAFGRLASPVAVRGPGVPYSMGRSWRALVNETHTARQRFQQTVAELQPGPLQQTLVAATAEVDAAVGEALRLAQQGDRAERAQREVLTALEHQRRRTRSGAGAGVDASLAAATRAQHESAERLAAAVRQSANQLELVVARLHELTAHALELATLAATPRLSAAASIAERLAALREASAEVELAATV